MSSALSVAGLSDIGRVRARNEDAFRVLPDLAVAVVADGMGGHPGGDVASRIAADSAARVLSEIVPARNADDEPVAYLRRGMEECVRAAHAEIRDRGRREPALVGMGTTLTAIVVDTATSSYVVGHVGDSRAYVLRRGELLQITRDDTWVQDRLEDGVLTPEQARAHPFGHLLTQCVGLDSPPEPRVVDGDVEPGDLFLLCTDGLIGMLDDAAVREILTRHVGVNGHAEIDESALRDLVGAANDAGGNDNITAAIVHVP